MSESSGYNLSLLDTTVEGISSIKIKKRKGPRTLPWGTPEVTSLVLAFALINVAKVSVGQP